MRQRQSGETGDHAEEKALGEELLDDASATRADAQANAHLPSPVTRAGQEEVRDVHTRDEQEESDYDEHDRTHAHLGGTERRVNARFVLWDQGVPHLPLVGLRVLFTELEEHGVEGLGRALDRDAISQPADGVHHVVAA